ncbi:MAG: histidine kinase dimerization/phospho-acceptor domain-containing protein, partial [Rhizomicrobium sp.]
MAAVIALAASIEANRQNEFSLSSQTAVVRYETEDVYRDLSGKLMATAYWQEAYDHIVLSWDQPWIEYQFGVYLQTLGIRNVAILETDGTLRYLRMDNSPTFSGPNIMARAAGLKELIAAAASSPNQSPTEAKTGTFVLGDRAYFGIAALVRAERIDPMPSENEGKYVIVFFKPAHAGYYDALTLGFKTDDSHISLTPAQSKDYASYPLKDAAGITRAYFEWKPQRPGANFLLVLYPVLAVMFLLLATMLTVSLTRWHAAQRHLLDVKAKATRVEEENRIKSIFLGNVSHELRTPLNAIIGFADMLKMQLFGPIENPRYNEYIEHIHASGNELLRIVTALIEISHIESEETEVKYHPVNAINVLHAAVEGIAKTLEAKQQKVDLTLPDQPVWCLASEGRLRQTLMQLFENAIILTPAAQTIRASCCIEKDNVLIAISDQRQAKPPQTLQNFDKLFLYSDDHFVSHSGGVGIGVVIASALTKLMKGTLDFRYEVDGAFTLQLRLPRTDAPNT